MGLVSVLLFDSMLALIREVEIHSTIQFPLYYLSSDRLRELRKKKQISNF